MQGNGGFKLVPDPPVAGQPLDIQCPPGTDEIVYYVDDGDAQSVRADKSGKVRIKAVPSGSDFVLWDIDDMSKQLLKPIVELE